MIRGKRALKVIGKSVLGLLLGVLGLVLLLLAVVVTRPELLLNSKTMRWAAHYAPKAGMEVTWKDGELRTGHISFLQRHFDFEFTDFCAKKTDQSLSSCFDKISLAFDVNFKAFPPRLMVLGPIGIEGGDVTYDATKAKPAEPTPKKSGSGGMPSWIKDLKIEKVQVDISRWQYKTATGDLSGDFAIHGDSAPTGSHWVIQAAEKMAETAQAHHAKLDLDLKNPSNAWQGPWQIAGGAKARFDDGRRADLKANIRQGGNLDFKYDLEAAYGQGRQLLEATLRGGASNELVTARLNATGHHLHSHLPLVKVQGCDFSLRATGGVGTSEVSNHDGKFKLDCPVLMTLKFPPVKDVPKFKWPTETGMRLIADLNTDFMPSASEPVDGRVEVQVDPILTPLLEGQGSAIAQIAGTPTEFPKKWKFDTNVALEMKMPDFQRVVDMLHQSAWPVPAPLNELKGAIQAGVHGKMDLTNGTLPIAFNTRLASKMQKVKIDGDGVVKFTRTEKGFNPDVQLKVALSDIQLVLPRLDLKAPPRFFPDARIHQLGTQVQKAAAKSNLTYHVEVFTPRGQELKLLSNLAKSAVPIAIDFNIDSGKQPYGDVNILSFPVEIFRRQATLEHFNLTMAEGDVDQDIDGAIRVDYTDYTIHIMLMGTSKAPVVKLMSDPPLPEDQLVAVLLFGHPLSELDPDQSTSVGDTRSAMTDGAIGLASLYVLASTPIESVGYDSATGVVSAKVRLGEGLSLNVGASSTQSDVGVRKRLGRHWSINTGVTRQTESSQSNVASAFLEWNNRY